MRRYEVTLPRTTNKPGVPRVGIIEARTAKEAKIKVVRLAGWGHCIWTLWHTKVRWLR